MKFGMALVAFGSVCSAFGYVDYYINDGARDWASATSYEGGKAPSGSGDRVVIRDGRTVYLDYADTDSRALLNGGLTVYPVTPQSRLVVDVPNAGDALELGCMVSSYSESTARAAAYAPTNGVIVKTGAGRLTLGNAGDVYRYATDIEVREGTVAATCNGGLKPRYGRISVSNNAAFHLPAGCGYCYVVGLWGEGLVTTEKETYLRVGYDDFPSAAQYSRFEGVLDTYVHYFAAGRCELAGTKSVTAYPVESYGANESLNAKAMTGVMKFGNKADASSSVGIHEWVQTSDLGGGFRYIGPGERTDKTLYLTAYANSYSTLNGGPNGGLDWAGKVGVRSANATAMGRFCLAGENAERPCVLSGNLSELSWTKDGLPYAFHVHKIDAGTWRFADAANNLLERKWNGGLTVQDGTVQFDSLDNRGTCCSLGVATNLTDGTYAGARDRAHDVDYAFTLGTAKTEGTLEFVGAGTTTAGAWAEDRKAVLNGNGRLKNSQANPFRFKGVRSLSAQAKTLTLDGASVAENTLADVTDEGAGAISLVKEGAGTWTLTGDQTFRGSLAVREGTLVVANVAAEPFSWFRWTIRQTGANGRVSCNCQEFVLYDANGNRVNSGLTVCPNYAAIAAGQAAYQRRGKYTENINMTDGRLDWHHLGRLFDNRLNYADKKDTSNIYRQGWRVRWRNDNDTEDRQIRAEDPSSWLPVLMRLPSGAAEVARYDLVAGNGGADEQPVSFTLEGSVDGLHWKTVKDETALKYASGSFFWVSDGTTSVPDNGVAAKRPGKGWEIAGRDATARWSMLGSVSSVSVAPGAVLKARGDVALAKLAVDAAGMGTIDGFAFAESGRLVVTGADEKAGEVTLPGTYANVRGLENLEGWSLDFNGRKTLRTIAVRGGKVTIVKSGLTIILK